MIKNHATLIILRNMFLRWMVRKDNYGVDFGIWDKIDPAKYDFALFGLGIFGGFEYSN